MTTAAAETAALALARERGLVGAEVEPSVIADRSNLVLGMGDALVARVAMATSMVRVGMDWLQREVEVSRFLDERGVGVTKPIAGPFERDGFVISFWQREALGGPPPPELAGAELRRAHDALATYDRPLPEWGAFEEARQVLERSRTNGMMSAEEIAAVDRAWEQAERIVDGSRARTASFQAVHGDAHLNNVLATKRGVLWTDWEDAFRGPVEYDLACLRSRAELLGEEVETIDAMCTAYGTYDAKLVRDLALVRNVQVICWVAVFAERDPSLLARMRLRIARL